MSLITMNGQDIDANAPNYVEGLSRVKFLTGRGSEALSLTPKPANDNVYPWFHNSGLVDADYMTFEELEP